jgi:hypothetical protein
MLAAGALRSHEAVCVGRLVIKSEGRSSHFGRDECRFASVDEAGAFTSQHANRQACEHLQRSVGMGAVKTAASTDANKHADIRADRHTITDRGSERERERERDNNIYIYIWRGRAGERDREGT